MRISKELGYIQGVGDNKPGPMPPGYSLFLTEGERKIEREGERGRERVVECVEGERESERARARATERERESARAREREIERARERESESERESERARE